MRAVIIANGQHTGPIQLLPDDLVVAVDGGARHYRALGLTPAYLIGDLDSLDPAEATSLEAAGVQIIRYPERKDFTDLDLAVQFAIQQGVNEVLILGALGARWDQTVANLLLPLAFSSPSLSIRLIDEGQEIHYLLGDETLTIEGSTGDIVSLIPLAGEAQGITTEGLEYPLNDENLLFGSTRGISNVMLGQMARISLRRGSLMCVVLKRSSCGSKASTTSRRSA